MSESSEKFIDIRKIIASKNPRLAKMLPLFIINFFKKIVHEDELNDAVERNNNLHGLDFVNAVLREFQVKINVLGIENIPKQGKYIIVANHPLGGLDGLALLSAVGRVRKDVKCIVNDLLLNIENLKSVFIPVNKLGRNSKSHVELIDKAYLSDDIILTFPAGLVSRKINGKIIDLSWKKSFVTKSKTLKQDVIPVYVDGRNTSFFYNLAKLRKALRIKNNIEMFFLVDEMYKQKNKIINIVFGESISHEIFDGSLVATEWAQVVRSHVYALGANKPLPLMTKKIIS